MISLPLALVLLFLTYAQGDAVESDNAVIARSIDESLGFCSEIRRKYSRLIPAMQYYRMSDYFSGNSTQYQKFLDAAEDTKTFFEPKLYRQVENFGSPKVLNFKITNSTLLTSLSDEMAKAVQLIRRVKLLEFGSESSPAPTKLDISFNYYHFFSPSIPEYYESIKGEFPSYLTHPKAINLEGFNVQVGKTPTGVHNQGNQNIGNRFNRLGVDYANTFNIHLALTDVNENTSPLVFWQGARPELITSRYVYKLLAENPETLGEKFLPGLFSLLSWLESDLSFWKYVTFKAEGSWDPAMDGTKEYTHAGYLMASRYYLSTYCNTKNGSDLIKGIWFPVVAGQGIVFNPYQLHASDQAFPAASIRRHSLVLRGCDKPDCKVANKGYQPSDEKLYECFAVLFGYKDADDFKQTVFGTLDNKVYGLYAIQLDHPNGVTVERLRKHYARAKDYLSQDAYHIPPAAEKCFLEYLAIGKATNTYDDL